MKLVYKSLKEESTLVLTNFNCAPSQELLASSGMYKIIWARDASRELLIDGYKITLQKGQVIFCTPLNILEIKQRDGLVALVFNREFYCIREHDDEVSCNGFLFYGSSEPPVITLDEKELKKMKNLKTGSLTSTAHDRNDCRNCSFLHLLAVQDQSQEH